MFFHASPFYLKQTIFIFRGQLEIEEKTSDAKLRIENIRTSDEGEYKCEITFLDITKNCPVVQLVKLTTLGKLDICNRFQ